LIELFTDGGNVGKNPSQAGTWAWCLVVDGRLTQHDSGWMEADDAGMASISNNFAELYAAVRGMEQTDEKGTWWTDSRVTLLRLSVKGTKFNGVPDWLERRAKRLVGRWVPMLCGGHPTKDELKRGRRTDGAIVSRWNVLCDKLCNERKRESLENKK
jgi:hypothetical protein